MVSASVIGRRNEQSVNVYSILLLLFGIGVFWGWFAAINATTSKANLQQSARATRLWEQTHGTVTSDPALRSGNMGNNITSIPNTTPTPGLTPSPTATTTPTPTPLYSINFAFKYSYYNPKLGGANCYTWDEATQDCLSKMANGEDWRTQYGVAVACPPEMALGTIVQVTFPDALKGFWICKDRGSAITGTWIDFLDITKRYDWGGPVSAILYPPTTPMEQITNGSH